jgi:hypothetical protein
MFPLFFGVPQSVVRLGALAELKPTELKLYLGLLHESERYRTRELRRTDAKLRELVGGSERAFRNARIKLQERGLIQFRAGLGNVYVYILCDPETSQPWPGTSKVPFRYVRKADQSKPANGTVKTNAEVPDTPHGVSVRFD